MKHIGCVRVHNSSHKPIPMFGKKYKFYKVPENYKFITKILGVSNELKTSFIQLNRFAECLVETNT